MNKKALNKLECLYKYSQALDIMPPRGDGAKDAAAEEIHNMCAKTFNMMTKQLRFHPDTFVAMSCVLLEIIERMLLDKLDGGYTPEELDNR
jgi:hypothetical protein